MLRRPDGQRLGRNQQVDSRRRDFPTELLTTACIETSAFVENVFVKNRRKRGPTEQELAKHADHLAAFQGLHDDIESRHRATVPMALAAERIVAMPDYPGRILLKRILEQWDAELKVALCRAIAAQPFESRRRWPTHTCFKALSELATPEAQALLSWCVARQISAGTAGHYLMKALRFPRIGVAWKVLGELGRSFSSEGASRFLELLGVDPKTFEVDLGRAQAFHGPLFTEVEAIRAAPEKVVAVDLRTKRFRSLPEDLYRCPNLRYLIIDDDFFRDEQMKKIEASLPAVEVRWTMAQYVDGKHGR